MVAVFLFRDGAPADAGGWALTVLGIALAAAPGVVLFVLAAALASLAALPARVRATPGQARDRAAELRAMSEAIRAARGTRVTRLPFLLWRLTRVAGGARELLGPHAGALPLVSVPFLLLSAAAVPATLVLVAVALVLLLLLAF
ncbi:MAG: hypothetical protein ICV67_02695 [Thermoleophilia bacterium]|nr:hypothetical protein [Thermoleophilia bacterium]